MSDPIDKPLDFTFRAWMRCLGWIKKIDHNIYLCTKYPSRHKTICTSDRRVFGNLLIWNLRLVVSLLGRRDVCKKKNRIYKKINQVCILHRYWGIMNWSVTFRLLANPFHATALFLYLQKTEIQRFFYVFRGHRNR